MRVRSRHPVTRDEVLRAMSESFRRTGHLLAEFERSSRGHEPDPVLRPARRPASVTVERALRSRPTASEMVDIVPTASRRPKKLRVKFQPRTRADRLKWVVESSPYHVVARAETPMVAMAAARAYIAEKEAERLRDEEACM